MTGKGSLFTVTTTPLECGQIVSDTADAHGTIMRRILDTQEHQVRQSLIALGWAPPDRGRWRFKRFEITGSLVAHSPEGQEFIVQNGRFDTGAGHALLNAMMAALSGT